MSDQDQADVTVVLSLYNDGTIHRRATFKGVTLTSVRDGALYLENAANTVAIFAAGDWKSVHRNAGLGAFGGRED